MRIDAKSSVPVFRQIVEGMQSAIAAGVYRPGETIPSTRDLALQLTVNPNTVQRAYSTLVELGVLESRRGKGKSSPVGATSRRFGMRKGPCSVPFRMVLDWRARPVSAISEFVSCSTTH